MATSPQPRRTTTELDLAGGAARLFHLHNGFGDGTLLFLVGNVLADPDRVSINLRCGKEGGSDTALHISVRFKDSVIVLNTLENGAWQTEERPEGFPFEANGPFKVVLEVHGSVFKIYTNDAFYADFNHRIDANRITHLEWNGDIALDRAVYDYHCHPCTEELDVSGGTPFHSQLRNGFRDGCLLFLEGTAPSAPERFTVNLMCGEVPESDVALHISTRFDQSAIVLNTLEGGSWKDEERPGNFPFSPSGPVKIVIEGKESLFKLFTNDDFFAEFKHRVDANRIGYLAVNGDVQLSKAVYVSFPQ
ncbi:32 kDa beta-galactoside-binding lectin-like [Periplaneta americana]|uniref:32 kDa beta-galactoside-binding lectin-like n=1 Tax=Periplaneta americana TaxID=6978 RepID=UPI0037E96D1F